MPVGLKKDLSVCIKFLFIVHVHLHKQIVYIWTFYINKNIIRTKF